MLHARAHSFRAKCINFSYILRRSWRLFWLKYFSKTNRGNGVSERLNVLFEFRLFFLVIPMLTYLLLNPWSHVSPPVVVLSINMGIELKPLNIFLNNNSALSSKDAYQVENIYQFSYHHWHDEYHCLHIFKIKHFSINLCQNQNLSFVILWN